MIIIYGPTGVGKSELAEQIAHQLPAAQIINMDLGQMYTPLNIGTAKPSWRASAIQHHLFDTIDTPEHYCVVRYRQRVQEILATISPEITPILVGGSAFYLKSLFFPPRAPGSYEISQTVTWDDLYALDPERAQAINPHDTVRIERAWAIWQTTGQAPSNFKPIFNPITTSCHIIHVTRERAQLYQRINERVPQMLAHGWLDEVAALRATAWEPFLLEKKFIGYNELLEYLAAPHTSLQLIIETIAQRTRHYAKRQETFWRMLDRQLHEAGVGAFCAIRRESINLTYANLDLYIKHLVKDDANEKV